MMTDQELIEKIRENTRLFGLPLKDLAYEAARRLELLTARPEGATTKDAARYRYLRAEKCIEHIGLFIGQQTAGAGFSRWTEEHADMIIDGALQASSLPQGHD